MTMLRRLNLPEYPFRFGGVAEPETIYDPVRRKYVVLTPEEWVRQHFIQFLVHERGFPLGLMTVERAFTYQGMTRRADLVVHGRDGLPLLMVECKSPEVAVTQAAFDQVAHYNAVIRARYLVVTNGLVHYCARIDAETRTITFLDDLPPYNAL